MSEQSLSQLWFTRFAIAVIGIGLVLLLMLVRRGEPTFPPIAVGAYMGTISGVAYPSSAKRTFYVERTAHSNSLLVVVMSDAWQPQLVPIKRNYSAAEDQNTLTEDVPLEAVRLKHDERSFKLSGSQHGKEYRGEIVRQDGVSGVWNLKPFDPVRDVDQRLAQLDLQEWLTLKAKELHVMRNLKALRQEFEDNEARKARFKEYIADEDMLRERANQKRVALQQELKEAEVEKEEISREISGLVSELGLLGRITKRGKAVSLARKVTLRESKWYLANWRAEEDRTGLDEFLGTRSDIDLSQLEYEVKRARENQMLLREIEEEKRAIKGLEMQVRYGKKAQDASTFPVPTNKPKTKQRKTFWDRIW